MDYTLAAKNFLKNGFNVLPLQLDGSKSPVGKWKPYQTRFASEHELQEWFGAGQCGIGVIAGAISGNLHVIDFDEDAAANFKRFWADSQEQIPGIMDKLVCIKTPRPGYQVWLRQKSTPPKAQRLAFSGTAVDDGGNPLLTIETRGEAAYACAVGTPFLVNDATAAPTSSKLTPIEDAKGTTCESVFDNSSKVVLPNRTVVKKTSETFSDSSIEKL